MWLLFVAIRVCLGGELTITGQQRVNPALGTLNAGSQYTQYVTAVYSGPGDQAAADLQITTPAGHTDVRFVLSDFAYILEAVPRRWMPEVQYMQELRVAMSARGSAGSMMYTRDTVNLTVPVPPPPILNIPVDTSDENINLQATPPSSSHSPPPPRHPRYDNLDTIYSSAFANGGGIVDHTVGQVCTTKGAAAADGQCCPTGTYDYVRSTCIVESGAVLIKGSSYENRACGCAYTDDATRPELEMVCELEDRHQISSGRRQYGRCRPRLLVAYDHNNASVAGIQQLSRHLVDAIGLATKLMSSRAEILLSASITDPRGTQCPSNGIDATTGCCRQASYPDNAFCNVEFRDPLTRTQPILALHGGGRPHVYESTADTKCTCMFMGEFNYVYNEQCEQSQRKEFGCMALDPQKPGFCVPLDPLTTPSCQYSVFDGNGVLQRSDKTRLDLYNEEVNRLNTIGTCVPLGAIYSWSHSPGDPPQPDWTYLRQQAISMRDFSGQQVNKVMSFARNQLDPYAATLNSAVQGMQALNGNLVDVAQLQYAAIQDMASAAIQMELLFNQTRDTFTETTVGYINLVVDETYRQLIQERDAVQRIADMRTSLMMYANDSFNAVFDMLAINQRYGNQLAHDFALVQASLQGTPAQVRVAYQQSIDQLNGEPQLRALKQLYRTATGQINDHPTIVGRLVPYVDQPTAVTLAPPVRPDTMQTIDGVTYALMDTIRVGAMRAKNLSLSIEQGWLSPRPVWVRYTIKPWTEHAFLINNTATPMSVFDLYAMLMPRSQQVGRVPGSGVSFIDVQTDACISRDDLGALARNQPLDENIRTDMYGATITQQLTKCSSIGYTRSQRIYSLEEWSTWVASWCESDLWEHVTSETVAVTTEPQFLVSSTNFGPLQFWVPAIHSRCALDPLAMRNQVANNAAFNANINTTTETIPSTLVFLWQRGFDVRLNQTLLELKALYPPLPQGGVWTKRFAPATDGSLGDTISETAAQFDVVSSISMPEYELQFVDTQIALSQQVLSSSGGEAASWQVLGKPLVIDPRDLFVRRAKYYLGPMECLEAPCYAPSSSHQIQSGGYLPMSRYMYDIPEHLRSGSRVVQDRCQMTDYFATETTDTEFIGPESSRRTTRSFADWTHEWRISPDYDITDNIRSEQLLDFKGPVPFGSAGNAFVARHSGVYGVGHEPECGALNPDLFRARVYYGDAQTGYSVGHERAAMGPIASLFEQAAVTVLRDPSRPGVWRWEVRPRHAITLQWRLALNDTAVAKQRLPAACPPASAIQFQPMATDERAGGGATRWLLWIDSSLLDTRTRALLAIGTQWYLHQGMGAAEQVTAIGLDMNRTLTWTTLQAQELYDYTRAHTDQVARILHVNESALNHSLTTLGLPVYRLSTSERTDGSGTLCWSHNEIPVSNRRVVYPTAEVLVSTQQTTDRAGEIALQMFVYTHNLLSLLEQSALNASDALAAVSASTTDTTARRAAMNQIYQSQVANATAQMIAEAESLYADISGARNRSLAIELARLEQRVNEIATRTAVGLQGSDPLLNVTLDNGTVVQQVFTSATGAQMAQMRDRVAQMLVNSLALNQTLAHVDALYQDMHGSIHVSELQGPDRLILDSIAPDFWPFAIDLDQVIHDNGGVEYFTTHIGEIVARKTAEWEAYDGEWIDWDCELDGSNPFSYQNLEIMCKYKTTRYLWLTIVSVLVLAFLPFQGQMPTIIFGCCRPGRGCSYQAYALAYYIYANPRGKPYYNVYMKLRERASHAAAIATTTGKAEEETTRLVASVTGFH